MKTKYFALLIAAMGSSLSLGASISNLESAYSKNSTVYDGTNGDTLDVSTPTTLNVNANGSWTMAFTVSNLTATSRFECRAAVYLQYRILLQSGRNGLSAGGRAGTLTLNVGGFNYNGGKPASSPWNQRLPVIPPAPLTLFYTFSRGTVSISAMLGNDTSTLTTLSNP